MVGHPTGTENERQMVRTRRQFLLVLSLAAIAFSTGRWGSQATASGPEADEALDLARRLSTAYQRLAEQVGPAVVQVKSYRQGTRGRRSVQDGSGVVVRPDGILVTNNHVVRGADTYQVVLTNGRQLDATIVGTDEDTDLAVLKVSADDLAHAPLDSNTAPAVGQIVLAMGNPMGLGHTVTSGIVSGLGRSDLNIAFYEDFIQTDAAINPGNSGGPLIDLQGEVLGINTAMGIASNGDNGIAFAIPSRMVRRVVDDILEHGNVRRGFLGVSNYSPWYAARRLNSARERGYAGFSSIIVQTVEDGTPAESAGIESGDIVLEIHGQRVTDQKSFRTAIADAPPGTPVEIKVWRDGGELNLEATLAIRR